MTTMFPTPDVTGAVPVVPVPPLTSDDAAVYDDRLLPRWFGWGCVTIGLTIAWMSAIADVWFMLPVALFCFVFPTITERWFAWSEARLARIAVEAELTEIEARA